MNKQFQKLAEEAGFIFWDETEAPGGHIDWSCDYDQEFEAFSKLLVNACADELIKWKDEPFPYDPGFGAILIKSLFGIK
jgi:hypothetical protein